MQSLKRHRRPCQSPKRSRHKKTKRSYENDSVRLRFRANRKRSPEPFRVPRHYRRRHGPAGSPAPRRRPPARLLRVIETCSERTAIHRCDHENPIHHPLHWL